MYTVTRIKKALRLVPFNLSMDVQGSRVEVIEKCLCYRKTLKLIDVSQKFPRTQWFCQRITAGK